MVVEHLRQLRDDRLRRRKQPVEDGEAGPAHKSSQEPQNPGHQREGEGVTHASLVRSVETSASSSSTFAMASSYFSSSPPVAPARESRRLGIPSIRTSSFQLKESLAEEE